MPFPQPVAGLVIRYSYLWSAEYECGQEEGVKDRPCAIVLVVAEDGGDQVVTVLPITHTPPSDARLAVQIPHETKRRLGLDDQPSWIVVSEANRFVWPGPDLRLGPSGEASSIAFGLLPRALFRTVRDKFASLIAARLMDVLQRTE